MAMERYRQSLRRRLTLLGVMEALFFLLMRFGRSAEGWWRASCWAWRQGAPSWVSWSSCAVGAQ